MSKHFHKAGNIGNNKEILILDSVKRDKDGNINALVCVGGGNDKKAISKCDIMFIKELRIDFMGHTTNYYLRFTAIKSAAAKDNKITISVHPSIRETGGYLNYQNVNKKLEKGMKVEVEADYYMEWKHELGRK